MARPGSGARIIGLGDKMSFPLSFYKTVFSLLYFPCARKILLENLVILVRKVEAHLNA